MADTVQMNLMVLPETKEKVQTMAKMTFRGFGDTVDWVVAEAWERMQKAQQERLTVEEVQAVSAETVPAPVEDYQDLEVMDGN